MKNFWKSSFFVIQFGVRLKNLTKNYNCWKTNFSNTLDTFDREIIVKIDDTITWKHVCKQTRANNAKFTLVGFNLSTILVVGQKIIVQCSPEKWDPMNENILESCHSTGDILGKTDVVKVMLDGSEAELQSMGMRIKKIGKVFFCLFVFFLRPWKPPDIC